MTAPLVTLHVWRVSRGQVGRALGRMAVDRRRFRATPGLRFGRLLGTGTGTGFGPGDADLTRYAALAVWDDPAAMARFDATPVGRGWRRLAVAQARLDLTPAHSRGRWSGAEPFDRPSAARPSAARPSAARESAARDGWPGGRWPGGGWPAGGRTDGPVLALTRARLRPRRAVTFWRAVPPVAAALTAAPGLLARFGIGEAPIVWQGTVSVWRSITDLARFAYRQPEHRAVVDRTPVDRWYAEDLFARFAVRDVIGDRAVLGWVEEGVARP